jgi:hypothetical protein
VPRHIQKQREEAAQAGQGGFQHEGGLSIQTGVRFDGADVMSEMEDELWSPTEPTPTAQHFPGAKEMHNVQSPSWQNINTSKSS